ncbi:hypothetical protein BCR35DRAFT_189676 [Leucosporidium creatinivorum]|uniref:DNA repair protein rhp7 treble clef domain-containing protein n=1 Tax=Leucosporidium creatinivorum TaxID=106004 RepID=A0A1Y2G020_9BASI|nr:hypothetical protein BCR35DRAFT_189676 [Leucosporidium creatinivorum]
MAPRRRQSQQQQQQEGNGTPVINGPRSALTSFLHEQGITGPNSIPNYSRRPSTPTTPATASTSTSASASAAPSSSSSSSPPPVASTSTTTTTTTTTTVTVKRKASTTTSAAALKKKKLEAEQEHQFKIAGKGEGPAKKGRYENRTPGVISVCSDCGKRFTVTKYTATNPSGPGLLCSPCTSESIEDQAAGGQFKAPKPKVVKKKATKAVESGPGRTIKTLQQICISVIGQHINNVEALGDIGPKNLDRVAQIVCKNRALTGENLSLFLEAGHTELRLYDCTNLNDNDLSTISTFCPRLERLTLNFCGRLDDDVLKVWGKAFKQLKYLSLYAPYLVTFTQWKEYLSTFGEEHSLEGFGLRQSARFNDDCISLLVAHNPGLFNLQLSEIGKLSDASLALLHPLKNLTTLDISRAGVDQGNVLTDDAVVALIEAVGENLEELVLDRESSAFASLLGARRLALTLSLPSPSSLPSFNTIAFINNLTENYLLTDRVLLEGIKIHCPHLTRLSLHSLSLIQSTGLQSLFTSWVNPGLTHLTLHRVCETDSEALKSIISHSGHSLRNLDLHSCDNIEEDGLNELAGGACPRLEEVDLSFVRMCDNFVIKRLLDECEALSKVFVHGCSRVTDDCVQKKGVSIRGLENCVAVEL